MSHKRDERGATATEYGLLVGFIAIAIAAGVGAVGLGLDEWYTRMADVTAAVLDVF